MVPPQGQSAQMFSCSFTEALHLMPFGIRKKKKTEKQEAYFEHQGGLLVIIVTVVWLLASANLL